MTSETKSLWIKRALIALGIVAVWLFITVDDWSRDLTTNSASMSSEANELLTARLRGRSIAEVLAGIDMAARRIPSMGQGQVASTGSSAIVSFVRKSRVFRFKDDVTVRVEQGDTGPVIVATSESRRGVGDLGQNPRTLELFFSELTTIFHRGEQSAHRPALNPPVYSGN